MLNRLLESKGRRSRSSAGALASMAAHVVIIVVAVHATAQSRVRPADPPQLVFFPKVMPQPTERRQTSPVVRTAAAKRFSARFVDVPIDLKIPSLDVIAQSPTTAADFARGDVSASDFGGEAALANPSGTFRADQVERQVSLLPGSPLPTYPDGLRNAGIEGKVVAEFAVNADGVVENDSVRFVQSDNVLFEQAVRIVLRRMRFTPAEIGGKKVRQLVQMPFVFSLSGR